MYFDGHRKLGADKHCGVN